MEQLSQKLILFLKTSNASQLFIKENLDEASKLIQHYNLNINNLSTAETRFLIVNHPYDIKCSHCNNNKKFGRNKYYKTCGDNVCNRLSASKTTFNKFGVNNASQSNIIKQQKEETCLKNYGVKNPNQSKEIRNRGIESYKRNNIQNSELLTKEYIEEHFIDENNTFKILDFINFYGYSNDCAPYRILKELNINFTKLTKTSHKEKDVLKYIQTLITSDIITNNRNIIDPLELDIFIPEHNLAIEYNGLYWHSYGLKNTASSQSDKGFQQNRHIDKTSKYEELNETHQLFHIFENEWDNNIKQDIWKSILNDKFKLNKRIYARNTIIKEVGSEEANQFIYENHIQGVRNASIKIGLYKDNELLSIMTFGKPFIKNEYEYELIRFCNKKYTNIIGGASKLLKYFEKTYKPKSLLSYANRRWSKGNLYHKLGFELQNISKPNKFIIDWVTKTLHNRLEFQKHKLADKLELYDPMLSADQNIINNNYRIIWDCGNYVFTKNY